MVVNATQRAVLSGLQNVVERAGVEENDRRCRLIRAGSVDQVERGGLAVWTLQRQVEPLDYRVVDRHEVVVERNHFGVRIGQVLRELEAAAEQKRDELFHAASIGWARRRGHGLWPRKFSNACQRVTLPVGLRRIVIGHCGCVRTREGACGGCWSTGSTLWRLERW